MNEIFHFSVGEAENKQRLDEFLFDRIGALSKIHLRNLALGDSCLVNGSAEKPGFRLKTGDRVEIEADLSAATSMKPEPLPLEILYEDAEIIVVVKPCEMLSHPTRGVKSGTLLNALSYHLNASGEWRMESGEKEDFNSPLSTLYSPHIIRPGLIHRLDKKTSGLMVVAKTKRAHKVLSNHFTKRLIEKKYYAVVEGTIENESGVIDAPIGYDETQLLWTVAENGKAAETRFKVLEQRADTTLLELEPVTGRTNQLRIHCEFINHPIVGDDARGGREFTRLCLHAATLGFRHPGDNRLMRFETDLPLEMR